LFLDGHARYLSKEQWQRYGKRQRSQSVS
jgi:hypothetical protein